MNCGTLVVGKNGSDISSSVEQPSTDGCFKMPPVPHVSMTSVRTPLITRALSHIRAHEQHEDMKKGASVETGIRHIVRTGSTQRIMAQFVRYASLQCTYGVSTQQLSVYHFIERAQTLDYADCNFFFASRVTASAGRVGKWSWP